MNRQAFDYISIAYSVAKIWKLFTGPMHELLVSFTVISDVYRGPLLQIKLRFLSTVSLSDMADFPNL